MIGSPVTTIIPESIGRPGLFLYTTHKKGDFSAGMDIKMQHGISMLQLCDYCA